MLPFKLVYSDDYYLPIGAHVFPAEKYRYIHQRLLETGVAESSDFLEPDLASDEDVLLVHTPEYIRKLKTGTLSTQEEMQMEVPYSPEMVRAFYLAAGGSILAGGSALKDKVAFNIGGGFHHAFPDHGEDVHQGNGTAAIFNGAREARDPLPSKASFVASRENPRSMASDVFTISLHQENNYPMWKPPSSIDVNLPDGTGDDDYLAWLDNTLSSGLRQVEPELICYIAGADPYREDQLGGLDLTIEGLKRRDELMFQVARARDIPVMVTFAGGYARRVEDTVTIHCNTVIAAKEICGG
jgi:acetoin utilization deacetylase AcuC-like enzyme